MTRVAILGAGNVGHGLAALLGSRPELEVVLWGRRIEVPRDLVITAYADGGCCGVGAARSEPSLARAVTGADVVISTVPAHARREVLRQLRHHLGACLLLVAWEGMGKFAETVGDLGIDGRIAAGLQRSPLVCRTRRWLSSVEILGMRSRAVAGPVYPPGRRRIAKLLAAIMPLRCAVAPRYGYAALSPGNPLIHPARLFGFANHPLTQRSRFYADWDDESSGLLLDLHRELARVRNALGLSRRWLPTFADRAVPPTPARITQQIRGARALRKIRVPVRILGGRVVLDSSHRFCREDIGEGLEYIHQCAIACGLAVPFTSAICKWYQAGAPMAAN